MTPRFLLVALMVMAAGSCAPTLKDLKPALEATAQARQNVRAQLLELMR